MTNPIKLGQELLDKDSDLRLGNLALKRTDKTSSENEEEARPDESKPINLLMHQFGNINKHS